MTDSRPSAYSCHNPGSAVRNGHIRPGQPPAARSGFPGRGWGVSYGAQSDQRRIAEALAQSVSNIETAAYNALIDTRKQLDSELDKVADDLRRETAESDDQLREQLLYVLAGSISDRVKGAVLLGVGIGLAMAGSVVGTLA